MQTQYRDQQIKISGKNQDIIKVSLGGAWHHLDHNHELMTSLEDAQAFIDNQLGTDEEITIEELADEYHSEPFEIAAALDITADSYRDSVQAHGFTSAEAREVLDITAAQAADMHE